MVTHGNLENINHKSDAHVYCLMLGLYVRDLFSYQFLLFPNARGRYLRQCNCCLIYLCAYCVKKNPLPPTLIDRNNLESQSTNVLI
jgi:hypothetical protein